MLTEITVTVPPTIASLDIVLDAASVAVTEESLRQVVGEVARRGRLELADLTGAHRQLMRDDSQESRTAGTLRTVQNWIGGGDFCPRGAVHVPQAACPCPVLDGRSGGVRQPPRPARAPNEVIRPVATSPPPTATHRTEWSAALVTDIATSATAPTRVLHSKRKSSTA
jgi:hypothetical protein